MSDGCGGTAEETPSDRIIFRERMKMSLLYRTSHHFFNSALCLYCPKGLSVGFAKVQLSHPQQEAENACAYCDIHLPDQISYLSPSQQYQCHKKRSRKQQQAGMYIVFYQTITVTPIPEQQQILPSGSRHGTVRPTSLHCPAPTIRNQRKTQQSHRGQLDKDMLTTETVPTLPKKKSNSLASLYSGSFPLGAFLSGNKFSRNSIFNDE